MSADPKKPFRRQRRPGWLYAPAYAEKPRDNPRGLIPSRKRGRPLSFWTLDEFRLLALLEVAPEVRSFEAHPRLLMLPDGPDWVAYVPSMTVEGLGSQMMVELSTLGFPRTKRQERVARLARAYCAEQGIRFVELPTVAVRSLPRTGNAMLLYRYLFSPVHEGDVQKIRDLVRGGPVRIDELAKASGVSRGRLLGLAARGEFTLHCNGPIGAATLLGLSQPREFR